ncbi:ABC transporter permease [Lentilactobacillus otakiensis]|uniref:ABC transporter permease n=1 Tax=Lentilactobacillus otakiensis TaxID=481720 RepID=UPI003D16D6E1
MKTNKVTKFLFRRQIIGLAEMYLFLFAAFLILPFLFSAISGSLDDYSLSRQMQGSWVTAAFGVYMFAISTLSYENFKFLIQNGISRPTFFNAQIVVNGLLILIGNTFNLVYQYLVLMPLVHARNTNIFMSSYSGYIHNSILDFIANFIFSGLLLVVGALFGMVIGNFLTLFSKFVQRIILIATPVIGYITLMYTASRVILDHNFQMTWVANFAKFILGYRATGSYDPFPMIVAMVVIAVVMLLITRYLFSKKQLKRE